MKKIAFLINSMADGGAEKLVQTLIESLNTENTIIHLICLEHNSIYTVDSKTNITFLSNFSGKEKGILKLIFIPILAFRLFKYIKKNNIEIIQSHLFRANYVNILSKLIFRSRHICQIVNHGIISRYSNNGLIGSINLFLIKYLYPFSDLILSVSNVVQNDMQNLYHFKNKKAVIYNMFDLAKIESLSSEEINDFNFNLNKKYLISVGRLIKLKRNEDLILTLFQLEDDIEVIFIGEGDKRSELISLAKKLKLEKRVHFIGWVNNPYKYIKKCHILVSTSETESFGNVLIESMACRTIVISTESGGPSEIIDSDVNGLLFKVGEINILVQSIKTILNNKNIQNTYIKNGYLKSKQFDINHIIKEYKKVLEID